MDQLVSAWVTQPRIPGFEFLLVPPTTADNTTYLLEKARKCQKYIVKPFIIGCYLSLPWLLTVDFTDACRLFRTLLSRLWTTCSQLGSKVIKQLFFMSQTRISPSTLRFLRPVIVSEIVYCEMPDSNSGRCDCSLVCYQ